jgi:hypothetical protein
MNARSYTLNALNRQSLADSLAQTLGPVYGGFADRETPGGVTVTVYVANGVTPAQLIALDALMAAYDPSVLTEAQQADLARQQKLDAAHRDYRGADLDPTAFSGADPLLQTLARKIAWLEQEITALREG